MAPTQKSGNLLLPVALKAAAAGISVLPPEEDGTKKPLGAAWAGWQKERAGVKQIMAWYAAKRSGIGFVCGAISGNLEVLDFDDRPTYEAYKKAASAAGLGDLVAKVETGYCEATPKPGVHWLYRCSVIQGNQKLARRPGPLDERGFLTVKGLIETRGEGGYAIVAPSNGNVHETHRPYELLSGDVTTIATITPEERMALHCVARTLDEMPTPPAASSPTAKTEGAGGGGAATKPGDDFNARVSWQELLEREGWTFVYAQGDKQSYRRPGKQKGISATVNYKSNDLLWVFTSSTPLEQEKSYSKFGVYATLHHGGNYQNAARALAAQGYGEPAPPSSAPPAEEPKVTRVAEDWPPPTPFLFLDLPTFPTDALPSVIRDEVEALAEATQTPVDLSAMMALAVLALACQGRVVTKVRPGWQEPINLYCVCALPSGSRKSAVVSALAAPVEALERGEAERLAPVVAREESLYKTQKARLEALQGQAARARGEDADLLAEEAARLAVDVAAIKVSGLPRLLADDVTPEKLASLLVANGGRMAILSPEAGIFDLMSGRYGNQPNFDVFLKGHSGDPLRVDRINRPPEFVRSPALSLGLAVQPDALRGLAATPSLRGRGLLARFLYSWPASNMGRRAIEPAPVEPAIAAAYGLTIKALLTMLPAHDPQGNAQAHVCCFEPDAYRDLMNLATWLEPQLGESGDLTMIGDWAGKLVGQAVRIATLHHMAIFAHSGQGWAVPIGRVSTAAARQIGTYLIAHARGAFAEMGADPEVESARRVLRWITLNSLATFTKRDAYQGTKGHFKRIEALEPVLALLEKHDYIRERSGEERSGPGRKPSPTFDVNPVWTEI